MESVDHFTASAACPAVGSRRALVVLGMHRSGTSAVAGCLHRMGVDFGPRLMPPTEANRKGYFEHIDVVNLHDRLLMALGRGWDTTAAWPEHWWEDEARTGRFRAELLALLRRDFAQAAFWGIKDPRMCRLLAWWRPLWRELDTEPVFLIVVRDPREIADSLQRRDGMSKEKALVLWVQHMLDAERETRGCQRQFLSLPEFFRDWASSLEPLAKVFGSRWLEMIDTSRETNRDFLDAAMRRAEPKFRIPVELEKVAEWFVSRSNGEKDGERLNLENLVSEEWATAILGGQTGGEQLADAVLELANSRRLAAWYEVEWQKAKDRAAKYKKRLDEASEKLKSR